MISERSLCAGLAWMPKVVAALVIVMLVGCAAPKPLPIMERYRNFVLDTDRPFVDRVQRHLGLVVQTDPVLAMNDTFIHIVPPQRQAIFYAKLQHGNAGHPVETGLMITWFDTSFQCIKREDITSYFQFYFPPPEFLYIDHGNRPGGGFGPGKPIFGKSKITASLATPLGTAKIEFDDFENGCLTGLSHTINVLPHKETP